MSQRDLQEPSFFAVLWQRRLMVVAIVVIAATAAYGLSLLQPTEYTATGALHLLDPNTAQELTDQMGFARNPSRHVANQAELIRSPLVTERAAGSLDGSSTGPDVLAAVEIVPLDNRDTLNLRATGSTPQEAVALMDAVVVAYQDLIGAEAEDAASELLAQIDAQVEAVEDEIDIQEAELSEDSSNQAARQRLAAALQELRLLQRQRVGTTNDLETFGSGVRFYESPAEPSSPSQPLPLRNAVVVGVLGFLVALGVAWIRGPLEHRVKHVSQDN